MFLTEERLSQIRRKLYDSSIEWFTVSASTYRHDVGDLLAEIERANAVIAAARETYRTSRATVISNASVGGSTASALVTTVSRDTMVALRDALDALAAYDQGGT